MKDTITEFVAKLKAHLAEKKANYVEHSSWNGDTEGGFYDTDEFDFDKLCVEIDAFSESFKK